MVGRSPQRAPAGSTARPVLLAYMVLGLITGVVWMHALSGGHALPTTSMAGHAQAAGFADPCADQAPSGHCPQDLPEHPGPVCQSGPLTAGITIAAPGPAGTPAPPAPPPAMVSTITAARDAGIGTGCGPPSLRMLSISRT